MAAVFRTRSHDAVRVHELLIGDTYCRSYRGILRGTVNELDACLGASRSRASTFIRKILT